jgi:hypothetical protein
MRRVIIRGRKLDVQGDRKQELCRRCTRGGPDGAVADDLASGAEDVAVNRGGLLVPRVPNGRGRPGEADLLMMVQDHHQEKVELQEHQCVGDEMPPKSTIRS